MTDHHDHPPTLVEQLAHLAEWLEESEHRPADAAVAVAAAHALSAIPEQRRTFFTLPARTVPSLPVPLDVIAWSATADRLGCITVTLTGYPTPDPDCRHWVRSSGDVAGIVYVGTYSDQCCAEPSACADRFHREVIR